MRVSLWIKLAWLGLIAGGLALLASAERRSPVQASVNRTTASPGELTYIRLASGERALVDESGHATPLRAYKRIASASTVGDQLLLELAEPERIAALTNYGRMRLPDGFRHGDRADIHGQADVEALLALKVDLLVLNHFGPPAALARVRDAGIEVFDLGEMRGTRTLLRNIDMIAALLGDPSRGVRLAARLQRRMRAVAADITPKQHKSAVYVSAYAGQLFGGAADTSYHDVLVAAGLIDAAATRYRDWIHYDPEQLLALDPEVIVTSTPSAPQLCRIHGLAQLQACNRPGGVVAIDQAILGDPGLGMLDAAEEIRALVYGAAR